MKNNENTLGIISKAEVSIILLLYFLENKVLLINKLVTPKRKILTITAVVISSVLFVINVLLIIEKKLPIPYKRKIVAASFGIFIALSSIGILLSVMNNICSNLNISYKRRLCKYQEI